MFATLDKAKPDAVNIKGLNLAAIICCTEPGLKETLYILYISELCLTHII
jgi:hypothetical protein